MINKQYSTTDNSYHRANFEADNKNEIYGRAQLEKASITS